MKEVRERERERERERLDDEDDKMREWKMRVKNVNHNQDQVYYWTDSLIVTNLTNYYETWMLINLYSRFNIMWSLRLRCIY